MQEQPPRGSARRQNVRHYKGHVSEKYNRSTLLNFDVVTPTSSVDYWLPPAVHDTRTTNLKPTYCCDSMYSDLCACIQFSPCYQNGGSFHECMYDENPDSVPNECQLIRKGYFLCKSQLLNTNFRHSGMPWS